MEQDPSVSHACNFSITNAFYLQNLPPTVGRAGQIFIYLHRQCYISHANLSWLWIWSGGLCSALSCVLCTPAPGSHMELPVWFLSTRHHFGLGLETCRKQWPGPRECRKSMQEFQMEQLFVLSVWLVSLVYQLSAKCVNNLAHKLSMQQESLIFKQ